MAVLGVVMTCVETPAKAQRLHCHIGFMGIAGGGLVDDLEAVFLDNRIGQDFLRDALQLLLSFFTVPAVQIQDEKFALADVFDGLITQAGERVVDCLALRIEDRAFWHDPDMSFHRGSITFAAGVTEGLRPDNALFQSCDGIGLRQVLDVHIGVGLAVGRKMRGANAGASGQQTRAELFPKDDFSGAGI
jgi:hypothetical protein